MLYPSSPGMRMIVLHPTEKHIIGRTHAARSARFVQAFALTTRRLLHNPSI